MVGETLGLPVLKLVVVVMVEQDDVEDGGLTGLRLAHKGSVPVEVNVIVVGEGNGNGGGNGGGAGKPEVISNVGGWSG